MLGWCVAEAIVHGILPADMVRQLFLVVALSMAATPFLADFGQRLGKMFEKGDMKVRLRTHICRFLYLLR